MSQVSDCGLELRRLTLDAEGRREGKYQQETVIKFVVVLTPELPLKKQLRCRSRQVPGSAFA